MFASLYSHKHSNICPIANICLHTYIHIPLSTSLLLSSWRSSEALSNGCERLAYIYLHTHTYISAHTYTYTYREARTYCISAWLSKFKLNQIKQQCTQFIYRYVHKYFIYHIWCSVVALTICLSMYISEWENTMHCEYRIQYSKLCFDRYCYTHMHTCLHLYIFTHVGKACLTLCLLTWFWFICTWSAYSYIVVMNLAVVYLI